MIWLGVGVLIYYCEKNIYCNNMKLLLYIFFNYMKLVIEKVDTLRKKQLLLLYIFSTI